jgi:hypothetical protein
MSKLSEGQIIGTLKQQNLSLLLPRLWNRQIDSVKWQSKHGGLKISEMRLLQAKYKRL